MLHSKLLGQRVRALRAPDLSIHVACARKRLRADDPFLLALQRPSGLGCSTASLNELPVVARRASWCAKCGRWDCLRQYCSLASNSQQLKQNSRQATA